MPIYTEPEQPFIKPIRSERLQSSVGIGPRGNGIYFCDKEFEYSEGGVYTAQKSEFVQVRHQSIYNVRIGDIVLFKIDRDSRNVLCIGVIESISQDVVTFREVDEVRVITDGQIQTADIEDLSVTTAKLADGSVTAAKLANDAVPDFVGANGSEPGIHGLVPASPARSSSQLTNRDLLWGDGTWKRIGLWTHAGDGQIEINITKDADHTEAVAYLTPATQSMAGVMSAADKTKLDETATSLASITETVDDTAESLAGMADIMFIRHATAGKMWLGIKDRKHPESEFLVAQVDVNGYILSELNDNSVTGDKLTDGSVTNDKLAINSITGSKIANNSIGGTKIADGSIGNGKLMENSVNTVNIVDGAVTDAKISGSILGSKIAPGTIQSTQIASNAIDRSKIVDGAITTAKLAASAVNTARLADDAVTSAKIVDDAVITAKIKNKAVTTDKLAASAVTSVKLATGAVAEVNIADNAVTADKIRSLAVTTAKLANDAVSTFKIADGAVVNTKLANSSVTFTKLAEGAVRGAHIYDGSVSTAKIRDKAVTSDKLADDMLDAIYNTVHDGILGGGPLDTAAWTERACPGSDGPARIESIHGRTVVWNQLLQNGDFESATGWSGDNATVSVADGVLSMSPSESGMQIYGVRSSLNLSAGAQVVGHKYLAIADVKVSRACGVLMQRYNAGAYIQVTAINSWVRIADIYALSAVASGYMVRLNARLDSGTFDTADVVQAKNYQIFDLTQMFGAGNEPSTVAEFEALYPDAYYPYDAGSLLPVRMTGVESVGFNQWDEEWEVGGYSVSNGTTWSTTDRIRSKADSYIPVFPETEYCLTRLSSVNVTLCYYDADKTFISGANISVSVRTFTTPANAHYLRFAMYPGYGTTYNNDICINLSWSGYRNGEYEPYWKSERTIPAATYFPDGMRSAGSVYDELTKNEAIGRVGEFTFDGTGTSPWISSTDGDYVVFGLTTVNTGNGVTSAQATVVANLVQLKATPYGICTTVANNRVYFTLGENETTVQQAKDYLAQHPITAHIALATPVTTPIDPPLNLTYKAAAGGTERIMHTEQSAPPTMVIQYGSTADGIRDRALSAIAAHDGPVAQSNYNVGDYLTMDGNLYKVILAISVDEPIEPGINVMATTVMAELVALTQ